MAIATTWLTLSDAGGRVCVSGRAEERIITAIADGIVKPGHLVTILGTGTLAATTGEVLGVTVAGNATDWMVGIALEKYDTDCDTLIEDRSMIEVVIPKSRRLYVVAISDPSGTIYAGTPVDFPGADVGNMAVQDSGLEDQDYYAMLTQNILTTSRFAEVRWT